MVDTRFLIQEIWPQLGFTLCCWTGALRCLSMLTGDVKSWRTQVTVLNLVWPTDFSEKPRRAMDTLAKTKELEVEKYKSRKESATLGGQNGNDRKDLLGLGKSEEADNQSIKL